MRIPTTATEFLALFVATGQISGPFMQDAELSLRGEPACDDWYSVRGGDTCDTIAAAHQVPTYQIICENALVNAQCTNLPSVCLGRTEEDCHGSNTAVVQWPYNSPEEIAEQHEIPLEIFKDNNYCYNKKCPKFHNGQVVCIAKTTFKLSKCSKIF